MLEGGKWRIRKAPNRNLFWVVGEDGTHMSKEPIPRERAEAQRRALYASERQQKKGGARLSDGMPELYMEEPSQSKATSMSDGTDQMELDLYMKAREEREKQRKAAEKSLRDAASIAQNKAHRKVKDKPYKYRGKGKEELEGEGGGTASPLERDIHLRNMVKEHRKKIEKIAENPAATQAQKQEARHLIREVDANLEAVEREMGYKFFEGTTPLTAAEHKERNKTGKGMTKLEKALHQRNVARKDAEGRVHLYHVLNNQYYLSPADKAQLKKEARDDAKKAEKLANKVQQMKETGYGLDLSLIHI